MIVTTKPITKIINIITSIDNPVPLMALNTKGGKYITKISKPKAEVRPKRVSYLSLTHHLTSFYPKKPSIKSVKSFCEFNIMYGIDEGDRGTRERIGGKTTPLMHAALYGYDELVEYYLSLGADPLCINSGGMMAIDMARKHMELDKERKQRYQKIVQILDNAARLWKKDLRNE